jgi:uncharacterized protein YfaS (alpha-2-macroglobulin family)
MAITMLDALPYLIDYPYGCTEQTMSRFLPAAITAATLRDLGLDPSVGMGRVFGGIEGEHEAATHPDGQQDLAELDAMVKQGLKRLYDFQHGDGGWGWWKDDDSNHYMTAYVTWGLTLARDAGIRVRDGVLERAVGFLSKEIVEAESRHDRQVWMLHALATYYESTKRPPDRFTINAFDSLWENRERLNGYGRALLTLSAHGFGDNERARTLARNLSNGVKHDRTPDTSIVQRGTQLSGETVQGTAHWGEERGYWRWSDGAIEATSFSLRALLAVDPNSELIEPATNWLIRNRRGSQWTNTRDTAIAVLALNDYLVRTGELEPDVEFDLTVNGHRVARERLSGSAALAAPTRHSIDARHVRSGTNTIEIRKLNGEGPLYFSVEARFFSLEEPITPAGNEIFVRRQYYKRVGRPTLLKGWVYERVPLNDGETVRSGERVETVITIETKNDYQYLVFEDLKPAGLEAVRLRSGEPLFARELKAAAATALLDEGTVTTPEAVDYTSRSRRVHQELRDRKVALFAASLPQGVWEIRYELRAEVPGTFHALPVTGHAMYVPEIRANGQEIRVVVTERE